MSNQEGKFKYPGIREALDGNTAVIMCERESTDAAGAYPITPSTQMGEYWAEETAKGHVNISGRPLMFIEPEGEHAAAAVTAGLSMTGLRASNFSSGQGIAYMHESLYAAVGKRLTYVLNVGARAMTKATLNVHCGHDDYHCVEDTGFFQMFGKNAQHTCDLNIIAHKIAELALTPGIIAQDGFLTTHLIESLRIPERELIAEYLGSPDDIIDTPTAAQRIIFGDKRRRIPELWSVDNPLMIGTVQNQDAYMQSVAAQRPFFFAHIAEIADRCMEEFYRLTGRRYRRMLAYRMEDAEYVILGQGSVVSSAEVVADYLRETRGIKVGVLDMVMFRPFPGDLIGALLKGRKGVAVLERVDQPLAEDQPLVREIRSSIGKCVENGRAQSSVLPYPGYAAYSSLEDAPPIYSGSFGMGSRDLQPEGIIGAIENMLPQGRKQKLFYLSIDFVRDKAKSPKQEEYLQTIEAAYPHVKELAVHGSENPNLMPHGSIAVRFHSIGGWGAITTGKNLAMTLFELLGWHIKANPKYGSEKKGQPTTYYLSAAPEPIRINCEYIYVDAVLSPDPNVFAHTNAIAGLKKGGTFIIQSDLDSPGKVWASIPPYYRKLIADNEIRVFYLDAFKIAREEASNVELQFRMQGNAFQGAFFAAGPIMAMANLNEEALFDAIKEQLDHKFGGKGARIVEDNLRVVKRGFKEAREIVDKPLDAEVQEAAKATAAEPPMPVMLAQQPKSESKLSDIHRFWEQTGNFYLRGAGNDNITDPFIGLSTMPAVTGVFRDMTGIRFNHPEWIPENCTGCGSCWTICPDSAIPGLVNDISQVFETVLQELQQKGRTVAQLRKKLAEVENKLRERAGKGAQKVSVKLALHDTIVETIEAASGAEQESLRADFAAFEEELKGFEFAFTRPFFYIPEKKKKGNGGLLTINVNPYTCKGCMECVEQCPFDALRSVPQTKESVRQLKDNWNTWLKLPTTPKKYVRVDDLENAVGALNNILLDKACYFSLASGDGACMGCSEKTVLHLFLTTIEALMQPRVAKHVTYLAELIDKLEQRRAEKAGDSAWLERTAVLAQRLKDLQWKYTNGTTGKGRARLGMINSTGCTSVFASTYPFNPYPFPWANHLFQDSSSMAMGVFEGHMARMAEGFKTIRKAELELQDGYDAAKHDGFFTYFNWQQFSDEEFYLCPPVVAVGGDGSMYDIGFQNVSRVLMSGKPIKIVVVDTQVYSNTGGQACTSGFWGQVSDMAQYGKAIQGKQEIRKEIGLIGMAHRTTYVLQSGTCAPAHMIEGFVQGLMAKRPALFNIYCACQPEHGVGDDMGAKQAKMALESRAYPFFRYDPAKGTDPADCFDLDGNPALDQDWPSYKLKYLEDGQEKSMELPMTFADFALTEARFRKHFKKAPRDTWNENMVQLADFLKLSPSERRGKFPFIWTVDHKQQLDRVLVAEPLVRSCEERRDFWHTLKAIAGVGREKVNVEEIEARVRGEFEAKIAELKATPAAEAGVAPSLDTHECIGCGACIAVNPSVFAYDAQGKAVLIDGHSPGAYKDLVKAAECCPVGAVHPGVPADQSEELAAWIARGKKFN